MQLTIQRAKQDDLQRIQHISVTTYYQHFPYLWEDGGKWYTTWKFATEKLAKELADPNEPFFLAKADDEVLGYLKLKLHAPFPAAPEHDGLLLDRIYILNKAMGKGVGKALMHHALATAKQLQKELIWLVCMDSSPQPIKVYQRHGFAIHSSFRLDYPHVKDEFRGMHRMLLTSNALSSNE